jgi:phosphonatase-like hydrolase
VEGVARHFDLVAFDVAGTTISVADEVPAALRYAFSTVDLGVSDAQVHAVRGLSKRQAIENLLLTLSPSLDSEALATQRDAIFASFKERLIESYETATVQPIDGVEVTFSWLRERGVAIALTTGFDRELLDRLLARVGWTGTLDAVVCDNDVARGRPAPDLIREAMHRTTTKDVARVVAVGDTTADLYAANHAEVGYAIGVLSGAHPLEVLRQAPHNVIIESVADLPEALRTRGADE